MISNPVTRVQNRAIKTKNIHHKYMCYLSLIVNFKNCNQYRACKKSVANSGINEILKIAL